MRIAGLRKFDHRNPNGYFNDLPPQARMAAWRWLAKFEARWGRNLPRWRRAILIGQAKRLALNPPDSAWGRSMLAKRGGNAVQRKYQAAGRHPPRLLPGPGCWCRPTENDGKPNCSVDASLGCHRLPELSISR